MYNFFESVKEKRRKSGRKMCKWCKEEFSSNHIKQLYCNQNCRVKYNNHKNSKRRREHNWELKKSLLNDGAICQRKFTTPWDVYWHSGTLKEMEKLC